MKPPEIPQRIVEKCTEFINRSGISATDEDVRAGWQVIMETMNELNLRILGQYFHDGQVGWSIVELLEKENDPSMKTERKKHAAIVRVAEIEWSIVERVRTLVN